MRSGSATELRYGYFKVTNFSSYLTKSMSLVVVFSCVIQVCFIMSSMDVLLLCFENILFNVIVLKSASGITDL